MPGKWFRTAETEGGKGFGLKFFREGTRYRLGNQPVFAVREPDEKLIKFIKQGVDIQNNI